MPTLTVTATTDYSASPLTNIDLIDFTNAAAATATFASSQFNNVDILDTVLIDGNAQPNHIVVNGGSVDASLWQFTHWHSAFDTITLNGTNGGDIFTGSARADTINGNNGDDTITGGDGADSIFGGNGVDTITGGTGVDHIEAGNHDDLIVYNAPAGLGNGEWIDGGDGLQDRIVLDTVSGVIDFTTATILNTEELEYMGGGHASLTGSQIGGVFSIQTVIGSSTNEYLDIYGGNTDLSTVTFTDWTNPGEGGLIDTIYLIGTSASDSLTGSSEDDGIFSNENNDIIAGGGGDDNLFGGSGVDEISGDGGDDFIGFLNDGDVEAGETIDGGGGNHDAIAAYESSSLQSYDFTVAEISRVEELIFVDHGFFTNPLFVAMSAGQIGAGGIEFVEFRLEGVLQIDGSSIDIHTVDFVASVPLTDVSTELSGTAGADTIIGGSIGDFITGGLGADDLEGNGGVDLFRYDSVNDLVLTETVDGGSDQDVIQFSNLLSSSTIDLGILTVTSVEILDFDGTDQTLVIDNSQLDELEEISGNAGLQTVSVTGSNLDLHRIDFTDWETTDVIELLGRSNDNSITGSDANDTIDGLDSDDDLDGRDGDDRLIGGQGTDDLTGGDGLDTFAFLTEDDSLTGSGRDTIKDFVQGEDVIDLRAFGGFDFVGDSGFSGSGQAEIGYRISGGNTNAIAEIDFDGDGNTDSEIKVNDLTVLVSTDFLV